MKEKDAKVNYDPHQLVLYVEKNDGTYGPLKTGSFLAKNYLDDYRIKRQNLETEYTRRIRNGETTPIEMHLVLCELTISELALRTKIPKRKIKNHLNPKKFKSATINELEKYAEVFGVQPAKLLDIITGDKND